MLSKYGLPVNIALLLSLVAVANPAYAHRLPSHLVVDTAAAHDEQDKWLKIAVAKYKEASRSIPPCPVSLEALWRQKRNEITIPPTVPHNDPRTYEYYPYVRIAIAYAGALRQRNIDTWVRRMAVIKGDDYLPGALESIYQHRRSAAAIGLLVHLRMDGGAAEALDGVRLRLFLQTPEAFVPYLWAKDGGTYTLARTRVAADLTESFSYALDKDDETRVRDLLSLLRHDNTKKGRFLRRYVSELIK